MVPYLEDNKALLPRADADLCAAIGQASAIVGGKLYFAMGVYTFTDGSVLVRQPKLFSIPLDTPLPAHALVSKDRYDSIDLPDGMRLDSDLGIIMHTNTTLYFYTPEIDTSNGTSMWSFNAETRNFTKLEVGGEENVPYQIYPGGFTSNPATGLMYYTGSYRNSQKRRKRKRDEDMTLETRDGGTDLNKRAPKVPWMQILNATAGDETANWIEGAGGGPTLVSGTLQYVRYGKKGILVGFGGVDPDDHTQFADPNVAGYRSMRDIFIFDIDSEKWFTVRATGDIPDARLNFCAGVSSAPDDTSFQITIYGGYKLSNVAATNKVHVLVLPTFQWIDVTPSDQDLGDGDDWGRQTPKCMIWNDAQMIIFGGTIHGSTRAREYVVNTGTCNDTHPPLLVLDTTTFKWLEEFNPDKAYSQPKVVYDLIGGDWRGKNSQTEPPAGFNNTALRNIFTTTVGRINQPTAFAIDNPPPPDNSPTSNPESGTGPSAGTIVGAVIGGIAGAILFGFLIFSCCCRKRRQDPPLIPTTTPPIAEDPFFSKPELQGTPLNEHSPGVASHDSYKTGSPGQIVSPAELPGGVLAELPGANPYNQNGNVHELPSDHAREGNPNELLAAVPVPPPPGQKLHS